MTREEAIVDIRDNIKPVVGGKSLDMAIEALEQEPCEDMGEVSDGYHTFNQLYYQRAVLFATIVKQNKDKAWKSFKHSDGKYCFDSNGEWFIVGVDTSQGSYTYHYEKKYWDMFDCKELECGKEWDGHTEEDVTRLLSLEEQSKTGHWIEVVDEVVENGNKTRYIYYHKCSECGSSRSNWGEHKYCPDCGAKMIKLQEGEKINCKTTKCKNCINHNYCDFEPQESEE